MAILKSCCCGFTVRKGSYASAFYTLLYFGCLTIVDVFIMREVQILGSFGYQEHNSNRRDQTLSEVAKIFTIHMVSHISVTLSSLVALLGLYKDQRILLLPWILFIFANISLEMFSIVMIWLQIGPIQDLIVFSTFVVQLIINLLVLCLNIYCILCVISQFQEYGNGRGFGEKTDIVHDVSTAKAASNSSPLHKVEPVCPGLYPHTNITTAISEETELPKIPDQGIV